MPFEEAIGPAKEVLYNAFVVDAAFRSGFCWGISLALLVGLLSRYLLFFLKPIRDFFKPSSKPATNKGPSSFDQMMGCFTRALIISIVFLGLVAYFFLFYRTP